MAAASVSLRLYFAAVILTGCHYSPRAPSAGWHAGEWPSDQLVTLGFQSGSRRADLDKLVAMANADSRLWTVTPKLAKVDQGFGNPPAVASEQDLPAARASEYRALFSRLDLQEGWNRENLKGGITQLLFPIAIRPAGGGDTVEKGLLYAGSAIDSIASNIELTRQEAENRKAALLAKRIEGNWYIYARYNE